VDEEAVAPAAEVERELVPALLRPVLGAGVAERGEEVLGRADRRGRGERRAAVGEVGGAVRTELRRGTRVHRVPRVRASLAEAAGAATAVLDERARGREVLVPGPGRLEPRLLEDRRHVREVVALAVDRDLEQGPGPERV